MASTESNMEAVKEQALALPREARVRLMDELRWSLARDPEPDPVTPRVFTAAGLLGMPLALGAAALGVTLLVAGHPSAGASLVSVGVLLALVLGFLLYTGLDLWSDVERGREAGRAPPVAQGTRPRSRKKSAIAWPMTR
jgi:hypothetical protein